MSTVVEAAFDATVILGAVFGVWPLLGRQSAALRHRILAVALLCAGLGIAAERLVPTVWHLPSALCRSCGTISAPAAPLDRLSPESSVPEEGDQPLRAGAPVSVDATTALLAIWAIGTSISLATLLVGLWRLRWLTRRGVPVTAGPWRELADRAARETCTPARLALRSIDHKGLLVVWGWRQPVLLLPHAARGWDAERVSSALHHELAHVQRRDWVIQLGAALVRSLYWFHPLAWWACNRLRAESERACDDAVLAQGVAGEKYAAQLVSIARVLKPPVAFPPAPAMLRRSSLERRIRMILSPHVNRRPVSRSASILTSALVVALSGCVIVVAAATQFASLTGTIVDPGNGLLPGVTLVLTNEETKAKYEIQTDRNGRYEFVGLPLGTYALEARLPGFAVFHSSVTVAGRNLQQDVGLELGTIQESITIVGLPPTLTPDEQRALDIKRLASAARVAKLKVQRAAQQCPGPVVSGGAAIGGNIRVPVKYRDVVPVYPDALRDVSGEVVLSAVIGTDGAVGHTEVVSATHQEFATSAIDAVSRWEFDATRLNCQAVETRMTVKATFRWQ